MKPQLKRVLVVEDAPVMRLFYRDVLERAGYEVTEAENGQEGLECAAQQLFDLCIADLNMPVMDGRSFVSALRRQPGTASLPVLMVTIESGEAERHAALAAGANAFLAKPVPRAQLAAYAAAMLGAGAAGPPA